MAAIPAITIPCPACSTPLLLPVTAKGTQRHVGAVPELEMFIDDQALKDHAATHHRKAPTMATTRAKFRCTSVTHTTPGPHTITRYGADGKTTEVQSFPRTVELMAVMDNDTAENQRFAQSTPSGTLKMQVDNPAVNLKPGTDYYLDITEVQ